MNVYVVEVTPKNMSTKKFAVESLSANGALSAVLEGYEIRRDTTISVRLTAVNCQLDGMGNAFRGSHTKVYER